MFWVYKNEPQNSFIFSFIKLYCDEPLCVSILTFWCFWLYETNPRNWIVGMKGMYILNFSRYCRVTFQNCCNNVWEYILHSDSALSGCLFYLIHTFLTPINTEHVFTCLSAIWICSLLNCVLILFSFVCCRLLSSLLSFCKISLCIPES